MLHLIETITQADAPRIEHETQEMIELLRKTLADYAAEVSLMLRPEDIGRVLADWANELKALVVRLDRVEVDRLGNEVATLIEVIGRSVVKQMLKHRAEIFRDAVSQHNALREFEARGAAGPDHGSGPDV